MRRANVLSTIAAMAVSMSVVACSNDSLTGATNASAQFSKSADSGRPFKGDCVLTGTTIDFVFPVVTNHIKGTCNLSHLGLTTVDFIEIANFATSRYDSEVVFVAANGDELHASLSGVATQTATGGLTLVGTETATGGTGRFSGATGEAAHTGAVTFTGPFTAVGTYHFEGRLKY